MRNLIWILIIVSALSFVLAIIYSIMRIYVPVAPEGFSNACTNLSLLAIALLLASKKKDRDS